MVHKHREILNNRNAIFSLCNGKRAAKLSLNRMWRHFSLADAYNSNFLIITTSFNPYRSMGRRL